MTFTKLFVISAILSSMAIGVAAQGAAPTLGEVYEFTSKADHAEVVQFAEYMEAQRSLGSADAQCAVVKKLQKFYADHDDAFRLLQAFRREGKTSDEQNKYIPIWVHGHANSKVALEKVAKIYGCYSIEELAAKQKPASLLALAKRLGRFESFVSAYNLLRDTGKKEGHTDADVCTSLAAFKAEADNLAEDIAYAEALYESIGKVPYYENAEGEDSPDDRKLVMTLIVFAKESYPAKVKFIEPIKEKFHCK